MYSLTGRINYFIYSGMFFLVFSALLNHLMARFGHVVSPTFGEPVNLSPTDVSFQIARIDQFGKDPLLNEESLSFSFDMNADLKNLFTWNTNIVFVSLVC